MQSGYHHTKTLQHLIVRVPKDHASFVYFTLEAHEHLAFYSTLDESLGMNYRDIDLKMPIEWAEPIRHLLHELAKKFPIEYLCDQTIQDQECIDRFKNSK